MIVVLAFVADCDYVIAAVSVGRVIESPSFVSGLLAFDQRVVIGIDLPA